MKKIKARKADFSKRMELFEYDGVDYTIQAEPSTEQLDTYLSQLADPDHGPDAAMRWLLGQLVTPDPTDVLKSSGMRISDAQEVMAAVVLHATRPVREGRGNDLTPSATAGGSGS